MRSVTASFEEWQEGRPPPLSLTRAWVENYRRYFDAQLRALEQFKAAVEAGAALEAVQPQQAQSHSGRSPAYSNAMPG
jgi:hypothetical protein